MGDLQKKTGHRLYDLRQGKEIPLAEAVSDLKKNRIVLVGEHHNDKSHHLAQLAVIKHLKAAGMQVAIGLEMFRKESQPALDGWVSGQIDERDFQETYYSNWTFPWDIYSMIFNFAREKRVPMIGLNVSREITGKVSRQGFESLTEAQKGALSNITCRLDQQYMDYIKDAFGAHGHGNMNFNYFCEAQLVWDSVMAVNALDYIQKHPDALVVILTGAGHARKGAIPRQIRERANIPHAVILPEVEGSIDPDAATLEDTDYILLGS